MRAYDLQPGDGAKLVALNSGGEQARFGGDRDYRTDNTLHPALARGVELLLREQVEPGRGELREREFYDEIRAYRARLQLRPAQALPPTTLLIQLLFAYQPPYKYQYILRAITVPRHRSGIKSLAGIVSSPVARCDAGISGLFEFASNQSRTHYG